MYISRSLKILLSSVIALGALSQSALAIPVGGTHLTGLLKVDPGIKVSTPITLPDGTVFTRTRYVSGSYFVMNKNTPNAAAMLRPGTSGGIMLGTYQNFVLSPNIPHPKGWKGDIDGDGIPDGAAGAGYNNVPPTYPSGSAVLFRFFGVDTYVGLDPISYQSANAHPAPSAGVDMASCVNNTCNIVADFSSWEVFWNGSVFEQGPRPDNAGPFGLATGTYNLATNKYNLNWVSQIKGGPFGGVVAYWHIEGTVVPVPAAAWLFGSGLMALLGLGKRRKFA